MKNDGSERDAQITIQQAKDVFIQTIAGTMGVQLLPNGRMTRSINEFFSFLESKGLATVGQIDDSVVASYRLYARVFMDDPEESAVVSAAGAFIGIAVMNGWVPEDLLTLWETIGPNEYFTRKNDSLN